MQRRRRFSALLAGSVASFIAAGAVLAFAALDVATTPRFDPAAAVGNPGCDYAGGCWASPGAAPSKRSVKLALASANVRAPGHSREPGVGPGVARTKGPSGGPASGPDNAPGTHAPAMAPQKGGPSITAPATTVSPPTASSPAPFPGPPVIPAIADAQQPAFPEDAPDPDVIEVNGIYYAFTTGTVWGNRIGVAECFVVKICPESGWQTADGTPLGSTALPVLPGWEQDGTQTSPGVAELAGEWVMYYDAVDTANGHYCVTVAFAPDPAGPYTDNSTGPLVCQTGYGGSIDPMPFVDPGGQAWLYWKTNDGSSTQPAWLWAAPLSSDGMSLVGAPVRMLFQDMTAHPWEATIENPDMVLVGGHYYLFFSGGLWDSSGYGEGYALCNGPAGPCSQPQEGPVLSSYASAAQGGGVAGPGGGMIFSDAETGQLYFAYAGWDPACTSYACGGARELFVAPVTL